MKWQFVIICHLSGKQSNLVYMQLQIVSVAYFVYQQKETITGPPLITHFYPISSTDIVVA